MNFQLSALLEKLKILVALIPIVAAAQIPSADFVILPGIPVSSPAVPASNPWDGYAMLKHIAACESTGDVNGTPRQFLPDGTPLWGNDPKTGLPVRRDVGILQINTIAHQSELQALQLDVVHSESDNIAYGKLLFAREGLRPWFASKECWSGKNSESSF